MILANGLLFDGPGGMESGGPEGEWEKKSRAGRTRTRDKGIMLTTSTFAAFFKFVVWTVSSLYEFAVQSLHLRRLA